MNVALPALLVFILALPGIILRYTYRTGTWKIGIYPRPLPEEIAYSLSFAAALHGIWIQVASLAGYRIVFSDMLILLIGSNEGFNLRRAAISAHPGAQVTYFLTLYIVAWAIGLSAHQFVRSCELDLKFKFIRFNNFWHYMLWGEYVNWREISPIYDHVPGVPSRDKRLDNMITIVSCVVYHASKSFIYYGIPRDFDFDRQSGSLDRLVLEDVFYEELQSPTESQKKKAAQSTVRAPIKGDVFILKYPDIHNINIEYLFLEPSP